MAKKYIMRNGVALPVEIAQKVASLRMKGYTNAFIAKELGLSEAQVVGILNVNRE